jgi:hypothetical protein
MYVLDHYIQAQVGGEAMAPGLSILGAPAPFKKKLETFSRCH